LAGASDAVDNATMFGSTNIQEGRIKAVQQWKGAKEESKEARKQEEGSKEGISGGDEARRKREKKQAS